MRLRSDAEAKDNCPFRRCFLTSLSSTRIDVLIADRDHMAIEDISVTWNIGEKLSLSFLGQNPLYDRHLESNATDQIVVPNLFKRSTFATFTLQF
jgi:hypothetical protein